MSQLSSIRPFVIALSLSLANSAMAEQTWCLTRGSGADEHFVEARTVIDPKVWSSGGPIIINEASTWTECAMRDASCNVSTGDIVTVDQDSAGAMTLRRVRLDGGKVMRDEATMRLDPAGRFLSGFSKGSDAGFGQQVFLYYTGTRHCTDSGRDYAADALCRFYTFEVFPVGIDQSHRPDLAQSRWSTAACPIAAQQPGGGNGNNPPTP